MSPFRTRALAALLGVVSLGACATRSAGPATPSTAAAAARPVIVAENEGRDWLDVYVLHELGEWYLGRLAPGARATLPLPAALRGDVSPTVRLAVLPGAARTTHPSRDPRTVVSIAQPVSAVLGQRWTFVQGQLTGLRGHPQP
jgi:hypothetical protein